MTGWDWIGIVCVILAGVICARWIAWELAVVRRRSGVARSDARYAASHRVDLSRLDRLDGLPHREVER